MPLDTGSVTPDRPYPRAVDEAAAPPPSASTLVLQHGAHIGQGLRAAREARRLSVDDIAAVTRVRPQHIIAIEALDIGSLPSRPFAIGYVRAYARFLGVDEEAAIERFKVDAPDAREPLRPPVGVTEARDPRLALIAAGTAVVLGAIIVWNVAQRAMADKDPAPPAVAAAPSVAAAIPKGPVTLGPALPAPVESTLPTPYITPGLGGPDAAPLTGDPTVAESVHPTTMLPEARVTNLRAASYGAPPERSYIALRARKPATLVVNGPQGAIFSRALTTGETYRAPMLPNLSFDVSDPTGFDVYRGGQFVGQLPGLNTPIAKLGGHAPPAPAPAAAAGSPAPTAAHGPAPTASAAPAPAAAPPSAQPVAAPPTKPAGPIVATPR